MMELDHMHCRIEAGIVTRHISRTYNTVMALGYCQKSVSAQYLATDGI